MSLLIKGVEMPDSCLNCRFRTTILKNVLSPTMMTSVYACLINGMEIDDWYEEKHKNCPLIEIPTPHGRLIDEDKLTRCIEHAYGDKDIVKLVVNNIGRQPTIIEAEENE